MYKLYHYSNKNIKDKIKPDFFGDNYYTNNDYKISSIKRSFFFTTNKIPEFTFNSSDYLYIAKINKNKIYDLTLDKLQLKDKFKSIHELLLYLKKHYKGASYNLGYNVVILFYAVKINKKINRRAV